MIQTSVVQRVVLLMRPQNGLAVALSFGVGAAIARYVHGGDIVAGVLIVLLVHSAATIQNDLYDQSVDRSNKRKTALLDGHISAVDAQRLVLWLYVAAASVAIVAPKRLTHLGFAAVFMLLAWMYNCRPFMLSRRPISSIVVLGLYYGAVPLLYGFLLGPAALSASLIFLLAYWFLRRCSISILKDYKDAVGDKLHHKRTFYLAYGARMTAWASIALAIGGYAGIIAPLAPALRHVPVAFALLGVVMLINILRQLRLLAVKDEQHLTRIFRASFVWQNYFEALLLVCLVLSYS